MIVLANIAWGARYQRPQQIAMQFARRGDWRIVDAAIHVHLSSWINLALALRERHLWKIVYDCMDDWNGFPGINPGLLSAERDLVNLADATAVTGSILAEKWGDKADRLAIIRNGVDAIRFENYCVPNSRFSFRRPVIGYYGAIAEWLDIEVIVQLARQKPEWQFVLAGDVFVSDLGGLDTLPNVTLLGLLPYEQMPELLWHFDVCLIPFKINSITHAVDPVKLYEYLGGGKPVVTAPLEEVVRNPDVANAVTFAVGASEFSRAIESALGQTRADQIELRKTVARRNDWSERYDAFHDMTCALYAPISIVIVNDSSAHKTSACIESIFRNTTYPNLEVIVVDDGSDDESVSVLRNLQDRQPNLKVLLNEKSVGVAAAHNQGLRIAAGEILVVLNSGANVPRGWLRGLVRCLGDRDIGLVESVNDVIGKASRFDVPSDIEADIETLAHRWMSDHHDQSFDVSVLSMSCIAMRRETFETTGPLDEEFGLGPFEWDDYGNRVRQAGRRVVCSEESLVHHHEQPSFKVPSDPAMAALRARNQAYYESKWGPWTAHETRTATFS